MITLRRMNSTPKQANDMEGVMDISERDAIKKEVERHFRGFDAGSSFWNGVHHGSLYLAVGLSAAVALILKLDSLKNSVAQTDLAATLSVLAALLVALAAAGDFQRKCRAHRKSRSSLDQLKIDLSSSAADGAVIGGRLKEIIANHERILVHEE
jgi:hypothetical protein